MWSFPRYQYKTYWYPYASKMQPKRVGRLSNAQQPVARGGLDLKAKAKASKLLSNELLKHYFYIL
jgi:hypothetical protein